MLSDSVIFGRFVCVHVSAFVCACNVFHASSLFCFLLPLFSSVLLLCFVLPVCFLKRRMC